MKKQLTMWWISIAIILSLSLGGCQTVRTGQVYPTTGNVKDLSEDPDFPGMARDYPRLTKRMLKTVSRLEAEVKERDVK